jgi:hypothetical protein
MRRVFSHPCWALSQLPSRYPVKRLKAEGYARVDEVLIFQAIQEMRTIEQESERKTRKARRAREMRDNPPRPPASTPPKPGPSSAVTIPETDQYPDTVEAFEGIIEPDWLCPGATC